MFTKVESNITTQELHHNMCFPHLFSTIGQAQNTHQPLPSGGRKADKYISQNTVAFANYFSTFVTWDSYVTAAFLFHSLPPSLLSSLLPSLPLFLSFSSHFICLLNQRKQICCHLILLHWENIAWMSFLMASVANIFVGTNLEFIVGIPPLWV